MTGFVHVTGPCICCKRVFSFNPLRVPSTSAVTGEREPICSTCIVLVNDGRRAKGLPEWPVAHDDYQAIEESEL